MASMRDVKRKIKATASMKQITKAMNLVSAAKLQKTRQRLADTRPFSQETKNVIASIVNSSKGIQHPFLEVRTVKKTMFIAIASDRGLCGGFNANVSKETLNQVQARGDVDVLTVGNFIHNYLRRRNVTIFKDFPNISENPDYKQAARIGEIAVNRFLKKEVDEIYLVYTSFVSTISHIPVVTRLLPVDASKLSNEQEGTAQMIYEPGEEEVLDDVIPKYVNTLIFNGLVESATSQQGARMTAMDNATENAQEVIEHYTLLYNRARQGAITQEITEIVAGADALG